MAPKNILLLLLLCITSILSASHSHITQLYALENTETTQSYAYQITDWWNYDYTKRKKLNLYTNSIQTPTNYQIHINLTYTPAMNPTFNDLRIISYTDNSTQLNYWIENQSTSNYCNIWIKIPENITSINTTHAWIYYGNPSAASQNNGEATFEFFDDFNTDLSKWTKHKKQGNYPLIDNNTLLCGGGSTTSPYGHTAIGTNTSYNTFLNGIIEADVYPSIDALPEITFRGNYTTNTGYKGRWDCRSGSETPWMKPSYNGWSGFGTSVTRFGRENQWQKTTLIINTTTFHIYTNNTQKASVTDSDYQNAGEIALMNHYGSYSRFDNVRVRKYSQQIPTYYIGPEESA